MKDMTWKEAIIIIINTIIAFIGGIVFYVGTNIVINELYRLNEPIMVGISLMIMGAILILVFIKFIAKE